MTILAIDTSGLAASVSVAQNNKLLGEFFIDLKLTHSQTLMPMMDTLLKSVELTLTNIDYIAVTSGPGSFTGLRIGASAAQGLAIALNKDIVPVPTLDALAYNILNYNALIVPIMDAKRDQVYSAVYTYEGDKLTKLTDYLAEDIDEIINITNRLANGRNVVFTGDGTDIFKERIEKNGFFVAPSHLNRQRAAAVAALAMQYALNKKTIAPDGFTPLYIRKPQAERVLEEKNE